MNANNNRWLRLGVAVSVCALGALTGCQSNQLVQERDDLYAQNQELQVQLTNTYTALETAQTERDQYRGQAQQLQEELAARAQQATSTAAANTGFGGIQGVEAVASRGRITVRIPGDVLFTSGKANLKSSAQRTLGQIAEVIQQQYPANTIRVEGYTDTDPIRKSKWKDNLELSLQRAAAVHRFLQKSGVKPGQMEAVGLGQWHPRSSRAKSRRVEIVVVLGS